MLKDLVRRGKHCRGRKRQAVQDLQHYMEVNEEQTRYDVFRAKGYSVGSGMVEGACHRRGRRPPQGLRNDLEPGRLGRDAGMRICWLNHEWDQLWQQKPLAA